MLVRANAQLCDPVTITIGEPVLTLNKTIYGIGEAISVSYKNAYASHDKGLGVEIRIYKPGDTPGVIASQDYYILQNKTSGISRPETGTVTFPADGGRNKTEYAAGDYVMMVLYANTPISEPVAFKVVDSLIFSTDKTEYAPGEPVKVTYGNVDKGYDKGNGIEIRLYKKGDTPGAVASQDYITLHSTSKGIDLLSSGVVTFPNDGEMNKTDYAAGTYEVMLLQGNTQLCDPISIKINAPVPKISLSKTNYKPGEVIKVNCENVSNALDAGLGLEIRIYKQGDTPGVIASQDYVILHNSGQGIDRTGAGTLSFPGDGARGKTEYAPGTYVVMLVQGNTPVVDSVTFTVTDNPPTGDNGTVFTFVLLISLSAVLLVKKKGFII
jgi:hypothetical protein